MIDVIQAIATKNACYVAKKPMTPMGIVLHSTGCNNPNLKRYVDSPAECGINQYNNHWNICHPGGKDMEYHAYVDKNNDNRCDICGGRRVCVHDFIGYDKNKNIRVAHILPYEIASWGCGGSYNYNPTGHIQIEICEDNMSNKDYFQQAFDIAIEHCANLCKQYNIKPSNIVSHKEAHTRGCASNHGDCDYWLKKYGKTMNDVRKLVEARLNGQPTSIFGETKETLKYTDVYYTVEITASPTLNVRKGPGYGYTLVKRLNKGTAHVIIQEAQVDGKTWGKLQSGDGWICLTGFTRKKATQIEEGSKVRIKPGAVYGGLTSARGRLVPATYTSTSRTYTVSRIQTNKGVKEALLKELYSWVAVSQLTIV